MLATYWPHLLAVAVGVGLTLQIGMNAMLGRVVGHPLWGAVANFTVGLIALLICVIAGGVRHVPGSVAQVPAWAWLGGLLGAAYVASATVLGPRLGGVALLALVLVGQLTASLLVDQFGVLGFPKIEISASRLVGVALLLAGTLLVVRR
ncbi:MAG: DMT family transporter [Steroidobacteraceae bacterium]